MPLLTGTGRFPANPVTGDLVYFDGTNWVRLAIGTTGQAIIVTGGIPAWGTAGLAESAEQSLATALTAGADTALGTGSKYFAFATLPTTYKFLKITAVQWSNGTAVAGNVMSEVYLVDKNPPVSANVTLIAQIASTAQSGTNATQKANVVWSSVIAGGGLIAMTIASSGPGQNYLFKTIASQNIYKSITFTSTPPPFDTTAWTATTVAPSDCTIFFKGYS